MDKDIRWFAARTRFGQELKVKQLLDRMGVENFIPTKSVHVERRGRKKLVEKPVISNLVFLRTDKERACTLANHLEVPVHYIIDRVSRSLLVVPDKQMDDFRRVLEYSKDDGGLLETPVAVGDRVRVVKGELSGVEGNIVEFASQNYIVVGLCGELQARAMIPLAYLEKVDQAR